MSLMCLQAKSPFVILRRRLCVWVFDFRSHTSSTPGSPRKGDLEISAAITLSPPLNLVHFPAPTTKEGSPSVLNLKLGHQRLTGQWRQINTPRQEI